MYVCVVCKRNPWSAVRRDRKAVEGSNQLSLWPATRWQPGLLRRLVFKRLSTYYLEVWYVLASLMATGCLFSGPIPRGQEVLAIVLAGWSQRTVSLHEILWSLGALRGYLSFWPFPVRVNPCHLSIYYLLSIYLRGHLPHRGKGQGRSHMETGDVCSVSYHPSHHRPNKRDIHKE